MAWQSIIANGLPFQRTRCAEHSALCLTTIGPLLSILRPIMWEIIKTGGRSLWPPFKLWPQGHIVHMIVWKHWTWTDEHFDVNWNGLRQLLSYLWDVFIFRIWRHSVYDLDLSDPKNNPNRLLDNANILWKFHDDRTKIATRRAPTTKGVHKHTHTHTNLQTRLFNWLADSEGIAK